MREAVRQRMGGLVVLAIAVPLVLGLHGCSPEPSGTPASDNGIPSGEPSSESDTYNGVEVGGVLSAEDAAALEADYYRTPYKAYQLSDGSYVLVNKDEPLPSNVQGDMNGKTQQIADQHGNDVTSSVSDGRKAAIEDEVAKASHSTGKSVILIVKITGYRGPDDTAPSVYYIPYGAVPNSVRNVGPGVRNGYDTADQAVAAVQAWINAKSNPEAYAVAVSG